MPSFSDAEVEAAAEATKARWCAMSADERRKFLRGKVAQNRPHDTELVELYIEYVATVSPDWMAMSFAAAQFLSGLCLDNKPAFVADFGSGFSSVVLRRHAFKTSGVRVLSVDDSPEWLERTGEFLVTQGLGTDGLTTWSDWVATRDDYPPFDLAFHDLASGDLRESSMALIADRMRVGGVLVFDDAQHGGHMKAMSEVARMHGWSLACLPETMDGNGRFEAMVVCRAMSIA